MRHSSRQTSSPAMRCLRQRISRGLDVVPLGEVTADIRVA
jgi:hypothetical protein